jgi:hypothetical protein
VSEISPRPWEIVDVDGWDVILDADKKEVTDQFDEYFISPADAEHIVKCVNEHDSLIAEVKKWKDSYYGMEGVNKINLDTVRELKQENERLKQMLRKCLPCGDGSLEPCHFCEQFDNHKLDCEYAKMTGGVEG